MGGGDPARSVDELMDIIFESLSSPTRRKILEVLINEGPLPYSEIMRRCEIKDSRTLKHHLDKLGPLIAKGRGGAYVATKVGREAFRVIETFREALTDVVMLSRSTSPLITFRCSIRHYLVATLLLLAISVGLGTVGLSYLAAATVAASAILALLAGIRRSKITVVGRNVIIEIVNTPFSKSKKTLRCKVLGVESLTNFLLRTLGLSRVSLITDLGDRLRTYSLGVTTSENARMYADMINKLLESCDMRNYSLSSIE